MMNNDFLKAIKKSFIKYLQTSPRSNEKLKIIHGFVANKLKEKLGNDYQISSLGFLDEKEEKINGKYIDKKVDITIKKKGITLAGISLKFIMSNYSQNSNNYFENMLGETANIRSSKIPYFQIFIIPDEIPYFDKDGKITKTEIISENNLKKYIIISHDDTNLFFHSPNKILFVLITLKSTATTLPLDKIDYKIYYCNNKFDVLYSSRKINFGTQVIYNDLAEFINKVYHTIKSI